MDSQDIFVWQNKRFIIFVPSKPHIDARDGGHLVVLPKRAVSHLFELTVQEQKEVMKLSTVVEKIMLAKLGAKHINIQANGNWFFLKNANPQKGKGPQLHIHLYGRHPKSKKQKWGEALVFPDPKTGWLKKIQPYSKKQIARIARSLLQIL